jgi:hypothetical protein
MPLRLHWPTVGRVGAHPFQRGYDEVPEEAAPLRTSSRRLTSRRVFLLGGASYGVLRAFALNQPFAFISAKVPPVSAICRRRAGTFQ